MLVTQTACHSLVHRPVLHYNLDSWYQNSKPFWALIQQKMTSGGSDAHQNSKNVQSSSQIITTRIGCPFRHPPNTVGTENQSRCEKSCYEACHECHK